MKQKVVIKVTSMNGEKSRCKAMQLVVGNFGVESAALKGDDKTQIEVTGDGVDAVNLTRLLRKKMGYAEIVTLGPMKEESKAKEKESPETWPYHGVAPQYVYTGPPPYDPDYNPCSIL
ncbi:disease resistance protein Pik-1-like [Mangifera indica]|uniref:disease resistance protein Pik-1-like n=1 Tax=Mangifera indica TaxID=29780 RepID=UPI001CFB3DF5|nr:disease resistance protein Pik-1-like [Mangifera indica]